MPVATETQQLSMSELEKLSPADRINRLLEFGEPDQERLTTEFVESQCKLKSVTQLSPSTAKAIFTFTVTRFYCNGSGNLHGGAQSMMMDLCTSLTLMSIGRKDFWINGGVSRTLTVNYLRPAPEGTEMELETEIVAAGKSMSMLRGLLRRANDGMVVSSCEHNKVAVPSKPNWKL